MVPKSKSAMVKQNSFSTFYYSSISALFMTFGGVCFMHGYVGGYFLFQFGFISVLFMMFCWWRDVVREATFEGQHTNVVSSGLRMGMLLFIVSEIMFFFYLWYKIHFDLLSLEIIFLREFFSLLTRNLLPGKNIFSRNSLSIFV